MRRQSIACFLAPLMACARLTAQVELGAGATRDLAIEHRYRAGIDVQSYDLSLDLPATGNEINGHAVLTVLRTTRVDTLVLDLVRLTVDSVRVDGVRVPFTRPTNEIHIPLRPNGRNLVRVDIAYH